MKLYTIGYNGKTAREFFTILKHSDVRKVIDVRLYPSTKNSGFAKSKDLQFFFSVLCKIDYEHRKEFTPNANALKAYKDAQVSWEKAAQEYTSVCQARHLKLTPDLDRCCFLCAEPTAEKCHRRLLAEYLAKQGENVEIIHL